jgi:hypothetical protein
VFCFGQQVYTISQMLEWPVYKMGEFASKWIDVVLILMINVFELAGWIGACRNTLLQKIPFKHPLFLRIFASNLQETIYLSSQFMLTRVNRDTN